MSLFDGMASTLSSVFGAPVLWTAAGGDPVSIEAIFRAEPIGIATEDGGEVLVTVPTLRVTKPLAEGIARGDQIAPGNGHTYRVTAGHPSGSPANDAFRLFELERL